MNGGRLPPTDADPSPREAALSLALEAAGVGDWTWELATDELRLSPSAAGIAGLVDDGTRVIHIEDLFARAHPEDVETLWAWDAAARAGRRFRARCRLVQRGCDPRWCEIAAVGERDADGRAVRMVGLITDVTGREETRRALARAHETLEQQVRERTLALADANRSLEDQVTERRLAEEQVRELLGQMVGIEEDERRRLSRELHDTVGQHLTAILMGLEMLGSAPTLPDDLRRQVDRLVRNARRLDDEIERLSHELRPTMLDDLGLVEALRQCVDEWREETGVDAHLVVRGVHGRRWPPGIETALFRVAQESLTNVRKHATATRVGLILEQDGDELRLVVEDDGRGFDLEGPGRHRADGAGLGLRGMAERLALNGGRMEIETRPGQGTTLFFAVPVPPMRVSGRAGADGPDARP